MRVVIMNSTILNIKTGLLGLIGLSFAIVMVLTWHHPVKTIRMTHFAEIEPMQTIENKPIIKPFVAPIVVSKRETEVKLISAQAKDLDPHVLQLGLTAYDNAVKQGITQEKILTIVDFSKPSSQPRLWVIDLATHRVLYTELVSHGRASGENYATSFSNNPHSNKSSLGLYRTEETYSGKHGYSLKLDGLEKGFNDMARARAVVMHSAEYVSQAVIKATGRLGRSEGCLALNPAVSAKVISAIKDGSLIFVYYPAANWLHHSKFLMN